MATRTNERLGLPYQGSKRRIATKIVELFPAASVLVDVFAGGCLYRMQATGTDKVPKRSCA